MITSLLLSISNSYCSQDFKNNLLTNNITTTINNTNTDTINISDNKIEINTVFLDQVLEDLRAKTEELYSALCKNNVSEQYAYLVCRKMWYSTVKKLLILNNFADSIVNGKEVTNINTYKFDNNPIYKDSTYELDPSANELYENEISDDDNSNENQNNDKVYKDAQQVQYKVNIIKKYTEKYFPEFNINKYINSEFITLEQLLREFVTVTNELSRKVIEEISNRLKTKTNASKLESVIDKTLCAWSNKIYRMDRILLYTLKNNITDVNKDIWTELDNKIDHAKQPVAETIGDLRKLRAIKDQSWL